MEDFDGLELCNDHSERVDIHVRASLRNGELIVSGHAPGPFVEEVRGDLDQSEKHYTILVKFEKGKSFITPYLKRKGFKPFGHGYCGCDWIWVLLDQKKYAYGMPGIKMAQCMHDHAVTVDEYETILKLYEEGIDLYDSDIVSEIYAKYEGLGPLVMEPD